MLLERKHSNLIVSDFSEEELKKLTQCCSVRYREKNQEGRYYTRFIDHYQLLDDTFLTSMAFLHGIKEQFPYAEINIPEREKIPLIFRKNFRLWDEQQFLLKQWFDDGRRKTISAVTGSGKTIIGLGAIFYLRAPTLIVVPKKEIQIKVWKNSLIKRLGIPEHYIGLFDGEHKEIKPFTITIYNSAYLHIEKLLNKFELFIADECHRVGAKQFSKIAINMDSLYNIAISATPRRLDGNDELIYKTMGNLICGPKFQELVKEKRISPFEHERIFIDLLPEEREKYQQYMSKFYYYPKREKMKWKTKAEQIALGSLAKIPAVTRLVFQHHHDKILIFTKFVNQAKQLKRVLKPFHAQLLLGETKKEERNMVFDWFHRSKKSILITSTIADEGVDIPDAKIAIIMSGFGTKRQMIQRIGRTVRFQEGKIAKIYEIVSRDTLDENQSNRRQIL